MTNPTSNPGQAPAYYNSEAEIYWGGENIEILRKSVVIDKTAVDAGNTPTTTLRKGLLLAKALGGNKLIAWEPTGTISEAEPAGILDIEVDMLEQVSHINEEQFCRLCVSAPVRAEAILVEGSPLIGDANEAAVRTALNAKGFRINDEF